MSEIKQAVKAEDWDRVIELANKAKSYSQLQKMKDAIADPAQVSFFMEGRNGQTVTYNFPIEKHEQVTVDYDYNNGYEFDEIDFYSKFIRSSNRKVDILIKIRPRSSLND